MPAIAGLEGLEMEGSITVLVGENGTGKSTFLEALALAARLPAVGSARLEEDPTLEPQRRLARQMKLTWGARTHRGFFLRAEDFFGFQKQLARARAEHEAEMARLDVELAGSSAYVRRLAQGPHRASLEDMARRYGADPDAASHGEAFLRLFGSRLVPRGLFLLDEPEAALSPQSQLAFLSMVKESVDAGSQFIIATHSPLIMAIPDATLLCFDAAPVHPVRYDELASVQLMRDFLAAPGRFLRHVWG
ncbi:MAG: ATP-binding cassette domain-containing protein [Gemmatimonadetes bacterium]|nr:ATP-binding cassette domain-containing protein [Gemmatimonadota bacterium]